MAGEGDAERLIVLLEARIRDFERNMQKASGTADRNYGNMRRNSRSATRQMEQDMVRSTKRINEALASTSTQFGALGKTFIGGFAGGMFATGLAGLQRGVRDLISEMSRMANVSKMVGIATEDLQRLRYAFEQTGVSADQTDTAMRRFARRIGEAANGGGQLHEVLKANNVQLRNADGSMRSQMELLRVYANLIKNAGSHQERLSLAFKAFDVAGADMVQLLANGADGLDTYMEKAEEAGGVIDKELVDRAAELDTQFGDLWRNFEMWAKKAIINVSVALRDGLLKDINDIGSALRDFINDPSLHNAGRVLLGDEFMTPDQMKALQDRVDFLSQHVEALKAKGEDALEAERQLAIARAALETEVQQIMAGGGEITLPPISVTATPTIIPSGGGGGGGSKRNRAADAALREAEAVKKLIENLTHELSLIGQSDLEKAKSNALRQAGTAATKEQRDEIERLVTAIHTETEAHKAAEEAQKARTAAYENLFQMAGDGIAAIMSGSEDAGEAVKRLAIELALAAAQAALLGTGPLAGLFGGGNIFGGSSFVPNTTAGAFFMNGFSSGTANTGGQRGQPRGIVHGQEAVIPLPSGGRVPVQLQGGAGGASETRVKVEVGVSVDEAGNLQAFVKDVAQSETAKGIKGFAGSPQFQAGVIQGVRKAQSGNHKLG